MHDPTDWAAAIRRGTDWRHFHRKYRTARRARQAQFIYWATFLVAASAAVFLLFQFMPPD
jgi:hypothetical protein